MENINYEYLSELIPDLKSIKKLPINDLTCNSFGFNTNFLNHRFLLELELEFTLTHEQFKQYHSVILKHFMDIAESELAEFKPSDNISCDLIFKEHDRLILLIKNKITNNG